MDPKAVPEIREAITFLEGYDKGPLTYENAKHFALAIETLDDYLKDDPDSAHAPFVRNLKFSYTRRMLQRLSSVNKADAGLSLEHILFVVHTVKVEAEKLMSDHPELKKDFDALLKVWAEPLARALIADEEREKARSANGKAHT